MYQNARPILPNNLAPKRRPTSLPMVGVQMFVLASTTNGCLQKSGPLETGLRPLFPPPLNCGHLPTVPWVYMSPSHPSFAPYSTSPGTTSPGETTAVCVFSEPGETSFSPNSWRGPLSQLAAYLTARKRRPRSSEKRILRLRRQRRDWN